MGSWLVGTGVGRHRVTGERLSQQLEMGGEEHTKNNQPQQRDLVVALGPRRAAVGVPPQRGAGRRATTPRHSGDLVVGTGAAAGAGVWAGCFTPLVCLLFYHDSTTAVRPERLSIFTWSKS